MNYATANGTATAGILPLLIGDYTSKSGTLTFTGGQPSKTITVSVTDDLFSEPDETFFVNLASANTPIADGQGVATILDDDLLLAAAETGPGAPEAAVTPEALAPIVTEAAARWAAVGRCSPPDLTKSRRLPCLDGVAWRTPKLGPARTRPTAAAASTARSSACLRFILPPLSVSPHPSHRGAENSAAAILRPLFGAVKRARQKGRPEAALWVSVE